MLRSYCILAAAVFCCKQQQQMRIPDEERAMHLPVEPHVAIHDAAASERYLALAFEALLLAVFLCTFTLLSIGLAAGIRKADSVLVPALHRAVVQPILGNWPTWP